MELYIDSRSTTGVTLNIDLQTKVTMYRLSQMDSHDDLPLVHRAIGLYRRLL